MKLKYDKLLSSFAFKFNLRHYNEVLYPIPGDMLETVEATPQARVRVNGILAECRIGRAVQVDTIKTRVESAFGFSA